MDIISKQVNNSKFKVQNNKIQKQFSNSECGIFCIIFLTQMLKQVPFDFICENMRTDAEINKLRDVIYHPSK
jgi:Ulp1 family protease